MIREAVINDLDAINKIGCQYNDNFTSTYKMDKEIKSNLAIVLVMDYKGVKGFLYALDFGDNFDLMLIAVEKYERGKKIATGLLQYFITKYVLNSTITLEVSVNNLPALSLYEKFAFKPVYIRKKYYPNGDDAILMRREQ